ncbi:hypothetical protein [Thermoanaerobacter mathranii]|uniref:hypothetical protein n=1 Tax=Thermoanaerobacter mathranii TaxID=583357 RepID=UPI003D6B6944
MKDKSCSNLPDLVQNNFQDTNEYLNYIYQLYLNDFSDQLTYYNGKPVKTAKSLSYNLRETTFEHIVTEKYQGKRIYDMERCKRIKWVKYLLMNPICQKCSYLRCFREKAKRVIIWCTKVDYVIVLDDRKDHYFLVTAYYVKYENKRRELQYKANLFVHKNRSRPHI